MVVKAPRELLDMERGSYLDDVDENSSFGEDDEHLSEQAINYVIRSGNDKARVNERTAHDKAHDEDDDEEGQVGHVCQPGSVVAFETLVHESKLSLLLLSKRPVVH